MADDQTMVPLHRHCVHTEVGQETRDEGQTCSRVPGAAVLAGEGCSRGGGLLDPHLLSGRGFLSAILHSLI